MIENQDENEDEDEMVESDENIVGNQQETITPYPLATDMGTPYSASRSPAMSNNGGNASSMLSIAKPASENANSYSNPDLQSSRSNEDQSLGEPLSTDSHTGQLVQPPENDTDLAHRVVQTLDNHGSSGSVVGNEDDGTVISKNNVTNSTTMALNVRKV